jgi:hypothetical protein
MMNQCVDCIIAIDIDNQLFTFIVQSNQCKWIVLQYIKGQYSKM